MRLFGLTVALIALLLPACAEKPGEERESLLREKDRELIAATFDGMKVTAKLILFTSREECEYCDLTEGFLEDIVSLAPGVSLEVHLLEKEGEEAARYGIDKAPGIAVVGAEDYGVRYYGLPSGYEFSAFIDMIRFVAEGVSNLLPETEEGLAGLKKPAIITVFSTKS